MKQLQKSTLPQLSAAYVLAWIVGLSTGVPSLVLNAGGSKVAAAYTTHKTAAVLQFIIAEGVTGLMLLLLVLGVTRRTPKASAMRKLFSVSGVLAGLLSLTMAILGLVLVLHIVPQGNMASIGKWSNAINRVDGPKMWILGLMALGGARAFIKLPKWHKITGYALALSLVVSGIAYGLLIQSLSWSVYVAGALLLVWVGALGILTKDY